jgi:saxitoxin biosynthesis operon SxtJ-like protein
MALVDINWRPTKRELRKFGISMFAGFAIIGLVVQFAFGKSTGAYVCYGTGAALGALGISGTLVGLYAYRAWMAVAFVVGNVVSRMILLLIYFGLFTPMAVWRRLTGNDPLRLKRGGETSYWIDLAAPTNADRAERQF